MLPDVYRSTRIVLDDTATHTIPDAFMNSRVFDALASGALVLTNNVEGSDELFDGLLPTYTGRAELREHLDHFLGDPEATKRLVDQLREKVMMSHTYARRPGEFVRVALDHIERPQCAIKIAVPDRDAMPHWGDSHFAAALAAELTRLGMPTQIHILPEWDLPANQAVDVVIHLRGLSTYTPKPAHVNVMWLVSHPDDVTVREVEKYDLVLVASKRHAEWLRSQTSTPVVFMPQATDNRRFRPVEPDPRLASDVLFLGNSRGQQRPAVEWAIDAGLPLSVYGGGWQGRIPPRFVKADFFPNQDLSSLYASAKVVLNDHWPDMRELGFVSNRIFDVLASGGVVVSDSVVGLEDLLGNLVPTFDDAEHLEVVVRELLADDDRRKQISHDAQSLVAADHTFEKRAEHIMGLVKPLLDQQPLDLAHLVSDGGKTGLETAKPGIRAGS
jgi:spore maturation protein CgeB